MIKITLQSLESTRAHCFEIRLKGNDKVKTPFTSSLNYYYADHIHSKDTENGSDFPKHFARFIEAALTEGQARLGAFKSEKVKISQAEVDNISANFLLQFKQFAIFFPKAEFLSSTGTRTESNRARR